MLFVVGTLILVSFAKLQKPRLISHVPDPQLCSLDIADNAVAVAIHRGRANVCLHTAATSPGIMDSITCHCCRGDAKSLSSTMYRSRL